MLRSVWPKVLAYALALLPITLVAAGQTFFENLANPYESSNEFDWNFRFTTFEAAILVYVVGVVCTLPFFTALRWFAGRLGLLNYGVATLFGGLTSVLSLFAALYVINGRLDDEMVEVTIVFALVGALSGVFYWWLERRLTRLSSTKLTKEVSFS